MKDKWSDLTTESDNPRSRNIDAKKAVDISKIIVAEDLQAVRAVAAVTPQIAKVARVFAQSIVSGGRVIYVGAGTSGRLGTIDAAELPPTFGIPKKGKGSAVGVMAGGYLALRQSVEAAEDNGPKGAAEIRKLKIGKGDLVIGISASSFAPFVRDALKEGRKLGASTALITMNKIKKPAFVETLIAVVVGPEVVTGSTRMKAGLATKAILHNISTTAMILAGKVYGNRMVDLQCWCDKLWARGQRLIMEYGDVSAAKSRAILKETNGSVKPAILIAKTGCSRNQADVLLSKNNQSLRRSIEGATKKGHRKK